jgi:hypothetical protein
VDQAARLRRREEARRRVHRQRRIAAAGLAGVLVLGIGLPLLLDGGGAPKEEREASAQEAPKPPELPRGGRAIFPDYRVVAFYGAPQDDELGELGIGTPDSAARRLEKQARPYARGRKVLPALELITVVAASSSNDGRYSTRQSTATIQRYLDAARRHKALLLLDIQPGRADFLEEVEWLRPFLEQPDVSLALDPEWHVAEGEIPGQVIGSMEASEVNAISAWLAQIVRERNLPQKLLVVHQFTEDMIRNRTQLEEHPGVALTLNVDGFGTIPVKLDKYRDFSKLPPPTHRGFKLFYREDPVLMRPRQVLKMRPQPELVVYE